MSGVRTSVPPFCVCEFMMALPYRLSTKKKTPHNSMIGTLLYERLEFKCQDLHIFMFRGEILATGQFD